MSTVDAHVEGWLSAGVIDAGTAGRIRAAEPGAPDPGPSAALESGHARSGPSIMSGLVGPTVSVAEVFGYLGASFLLGAWYALINRMANESNDGALILGIGGGIAAVLLFTLGVVLRRGDSRRQRAAGVAFVGAVATSGTAVFAYLGGTTLAWNLVAVIATFVAFAVSVGAHWLHASVLTQVGLLASATTLAGALLTWIRESVFPSPSIVDGEFAPTSGPDPIVLVVASAAWWLGLAVLIGLLALREARAVSPEGGVAAARRAGVSRLWAGFVAVIGLGIAVTASDFDSNFVYRRIIEPWLGELLLLILSAVLIERAFRREAASYVFAAALGLIVALSDFNFTYLADNTETGLFIEGVILLGAGVATDRLRRRIGRHDEGPLVPVVAIPTEG